MLTTNFVVHRLGAGTRFILNCLPQQMTKPCARGTFERTSMLLLSDRRFSDTFGASVRVRPYRDASVGV